MKPRIDKGTIELIKERIDEVRKTIKAAEAIEAVQETVAKLRMHLNRQQLASEGIDSNSVFMSRDDIAAAMALFKGTDLLLKKVVPDLKQIEHSGELTMRRAEELSDAELANIATAGSSGVTEAAQSTH